VRVLVPAVPTLGRSRRRRTADEKHEPYEAFVRRASASWNRESYHPGMTNVVVSANKCRSFRRSAGCWDVRSRTGGGHTHAGRLRIGREALAGKGYFLPDHGDAMANVATEELFGKNWRRSAHPSTQPRSRDRSNSATTFFYSDLARAVRHRRAQAGFSPQVCAIELETAASTRQGFTSIF